MENKYDVSIFIVTEDNQRILNSEYEQGYDTDAAFIMLTNNILNKDYEEDNSINIYIHWLATVNATKIKVKKTFFQIHFDSTEKYLTLPWQIGYDPIPHNKFDGSKAIDRFSKAYNLINFNILNDLLNGHASCIEIMSNVRPILHTSSMENYIPAITFAHLTTVDFDNKRLHGYLPAIGQWRYINNNIERINETAMDIGLKTNILDMRASNDVEGYWWSSTECGHMAFCIDNGMISYDSKHYHRSILPLYVL